MKKFIIALTLLIISPLNVLAYSEYIIPGGENIGLEIESDGLVVVGFYKVGGKYIGSENLKVGDRILEIEGSKALSINDMTNVIEENIEDNQVNIKVKRNDKTINTKLKLVKEDNVYKTGLYVKEKVTGIGTLTYIDPETLIYGALGHSVIMNETNKKVEVKDGRIFSSYVNGIDRSTNGQVGSKNASILYNHELGNVLENEEVGVYGKITSDLPDKEKMKVASWNQIHTGKATILTTTLDTNVEEFEIEIISLNKSLIDTNKSISFKVTDERLLERSGGIVQGMSGSPIIQDNMIVGSVTHVLTNDVTKGYGVFIRTMLEEGEN